MKILDLNRFVNEKMKIIPISDDDFRKISDDAVSDRGISFPKPARLKPSGEGGYIVNHTKYRMDGNVVIFVINVKTEIYPWWEKKFEYGNVDWKGVEKYKKNLSLKESDCLTEIGMCDAGNEVHPKGYENVCYPYYLQVTDVTHYVSDMLYKHFGFKIFGCIRGHLLESELGFDIKDIPEINRSFDCEFGCFASKRFLQNNDVNCSVITDCYTEGGFHDNCNIVFRYVLSEKEMNNPKLNQNEKVFTDKLVDTLFGVEYDRKLSDIV